MKELDKLKKDFGLVLKNNQEVTSSKVVAKIFGERHDHVLRDIENVLKTIPDDFKLPNFGLTLTYKEMIENDLIYKIFDIPEIVAREF